MYTYPHQPIDVRTFNAIGDGIADDTIAIRSAIAYATENQVPMFIPKEYNCKVIETSGFLDLPEYGLTGGGAIRNVVCRYYQKRYRQVDSICCDDLLLSGIWFCDIHYVKCKTLTIDGGGNQGTYCNTVGTIICDHLLIDLDNFPVNQNIFKNVTIYGIPTEEDPDITLGGLYITGGNSSDGSDCYGYNNIFQLLNITSFGINTANGCQILNDSYYNQNNIIYSWNGEISSDPPIYPFIVGNWHVLGSSVNGRGNQVRTSDRDHYMFTNAWALKLPTTAPPTQLNRDCGDYLAGGLTNLAVGGEWDILDAEINKPYCLSYQTGLAISTTPFDPSGCPSGINKQITLETSNSYQCLFLNFNFTEPKDVTLTMWYKGDDFLTIVSDNGSYTDANGIYSDTILTDGWKLLRCTVHGVTTQITLFLTLEDAEEKKIAFNSVFVTDQKTAFLPMKRHTRCARGKSSSPTEADRTFTLPLPTVNKLTGIAKIFLDSPDGSPAFAGAIGSILTPFAVGDSIVISSSPQIAVAPVSAGSTSFTVSAGSTGIDITVPSGINPASFTWELELPFE